MVLKTYNYKNKDKWTGNTGLSVQLIASHSEWPPDSKHKDGITNPPPSQTDPPGTHTLRLWESTSLLPSAGLTASQLSYCALQEEQPRQAGSGCCRLLLHYPSIEPQPAEVLCFHLDRGPPPPWRTPSPAGASAELSTSWMGGSHPGSQLFGLLPSGRRYWCTEAGTIILNV